MSNQLRQIVGDKDVRSAKNTGGSTISKGMLVKRAAAMDEINKCSAATDAIYGVAMQDILDGKWGNIQIRGLALALGGAAVTIGARVTSDANAKAVTAVAGNSTLGVANTTGAADTLFECELATLGSM